MRQGRRDGVIVYSTQHGRMCPACGRKMETCICPTENEPAPVPGSLRIRYEKKGRKGKAVTIVEGISAKTPAIMELARYLRRKCGAGGTVKGRTIEIQGDHRKRIEDELRLKGFLD